MKVFTGTELFESFTSLGCSMKMLALFYDDDKLQKVADEAGLNGVDILKLRKFAGLVLTTDMPAKEIKS